MTIRKLCHSQIIKPGLAYYIKKPEIDTTTKGRTVQHKKDNHENYVAEDCDMAARIIFHTTRSPWPVILYIVDKYNLQYSRSRHVFETMKATWPKELQ